MNTNIASITVLYNPDKSFIQNIDSYSPYVSLLIIIDNSDIPDPTFLAGFDTNPKSKLVVYNENRGVAKALNDAVKIARVNGFEWLLTMDQDSCFDDNMIKKYLQHLEQLPQKESIAAIGPVFEQGKINDEGAKYVSSLITSGSLINTRICEELGGFNEELFIDEVDHEYCYRAILKDYKIIQLQDIFLQHSLGKQQSVTTISGIKNKIKSLHSPLRLYYMVRNSCYVISKYKKAFPDEMRLKRKDVLVRIKNNFLYGNRKWDVLKYAAKGFMDCKRNRFGKYK